MQLLREEVHGSTNDSLLTKRLLRSGALPGMFEGNGIDEKAACEGSGLS